MEIFSNRDVFVLGEARPGGIWANAVWLRLKSMPGTTQELWNRLEQTIHGMVEIPQETDQIHTDIFLPYVQADSLEAKTNVRQD